MRDYIDGKTTFEVGDSFDVRIDISTGRTTREHRSLYRIVGIRTDGGSRVADVREYGAGCSRTMCIYTDADGIECMSFDSVKGIFVTVRASDCMGTVL